MVIKNYLQKLAILFLIFNCLPSYAHDEQNEVSITTDSQYRYVKSNGIPTTHGQFPNSGNPNTISAQAYSFRMPVNPQFANQITSLEGRMYFGVGIDGVPFDPGTAEFWNADRNWRYEALSGKINLGIDQNNAHVQPNGAYHYHGLPTDLLTNQNDNNGLKLVGYAADGFPLYATNDGKAFKSSYQLHPGTRHSGPGGTYDGTFTQDYQYVAGSGDLDECNGRNGTTSEYPQGTYYYYITYNFPIVPRCFKGTPDTSFYKNEVHSEPRGSMMGPGGRMGPPPTQRQGGQMIRPPPQEPDGQNLDH